MSGNTFRIILNFGLIASEAIIFVIFSFYTSKYVKQFKERLDPFILMTFLLIGLSLVFKVLLKLPPMILQQIYTSSTDPDYKKWIDDHSTMLNTLQITASYFSVCIFNIAILVSSLRWDLLIIRYRSKNPNMKVNMCKMLFIFWIIAQLTISIMYTFQLCGIYDLSSALEPLYYMIFIIVNIISILSYTLAGCFFSDFYTKELNHNSQFLSEIQVGQIESTIKSLKIFFYVTVLILIFKMLIAIAQDFATTTVWSYTLLIMFYVSEMIIIMLLCQTLKESIRNKKKHESMLTEIDDGNYESSINDADTNHTPMDQSLMEMDYSFEKTLNHVPSFQLNQINRFDSRKQVQSTKEQVEAIQQARSASLNKSHRVNISDNSLTTAAEKII